tara:strand:- start:622 stop:1683 length:1062 start_codon:yes stop_codon:yes gene_type:complete
MKSIIQISPTYPPNLGGVGNYAKILSDYLSIEGIKSQILISDYLGKRNNKQILFGKKNKSLESILDQNNSQNIILHYSGYGYAKRGLCFTLIKSLENWKQNKKNRKLITIFHEIYAKGPFYRISFWTSIFQKYLAKKLFNLSDVSLVTSKYNKFILASLYNNKKKIIYTNVFSNIGELKKNKILKTRKNKGIIFGNNFQKELLYKDILFNKMKYENLLNKMSIKEIIDIGPKINISKKINFKNIKINRVGIISKKYISSLLKSSKVGLVFYPVGQMTKSGIIAAYASHGMIIVNFCNEAIVKTNEFIAGLNYISKLNKSSKNDLQKISNEVFKLYQKNNLFRTVKIIIKNLNL